MLTTTLAQLLLIDSALIGVAFAGVNAGVGISIGLGDSSSAPASSTPIATPTNTPISTSVTSSTPSSSSAPASTQCPAIWTNIAADLRNDFSGCNQRASNAIRYAFHDAGGYSIHNTPYGAASGGADGSILLNENEIARSEQAPMGNFHNYLLGKYNNYKSAGVGAADFVQFAGVIGVTSCPGGPVYKTVVGRDDDPTAAPEGNLPAAFGPGSSSAVLLQLWADKGFDGRELAALMGAHSVSRAFAQQSNGIPPGGAQDNTPAVWDTNYYAQTQARTAPRGVFRFASDVNLAQGNTTCGQAFTEFAGNKDAWAAAFAPAAYKLSILGISAAKVNTFVDCTSVVAAGAV